MIYEFRGIDIENDFEISNAIEALRDFANDPNKRGLKDLYKFSQTEYYQAWALKNKFVIERVKKLEKS